MTTTVQEVTDTELVFAADAILGEAPGWDHDTGTLLWIDMFGQTVHRFDPANGLDATYPVGQDVAAVVRAAHGGLVCAVRDGFLWLDPVDGTTESGATVEGALASNRMNDGKCDGAGRFWAGTMNDDARPGVGALYRLEIDGRVTRVLDAVTISNGLGWSPDDRSMYYIDSATRRVDRFDFDPATGTPHGRCPLVTLPPGMGLPDGMCVDEEGCLWVALWDGWAVHRYTPDGRLDRIYRFPVSHVTSAAFGGADLMDLYVTTAWVDAKGRRRPEQKAREPLAGGNADSRSDRPSTIG